jgi:hypothetical protein
MAVNDDVFGYKRNPKPTGVFSTEDSKLVFGSGDGIDAADAGYLVQNWNVSYTQQVQEVFEIGSNALYWSKGRPTGTGTLGRLIGDKDVSSPNSGGFFPKEAYDICKGGATLVLEAVGGHCKNEGGWTDETLNKGLKIVMSGAVVTSIGFSMQVADVRLVEAMQWRFAYMKFGTDGAT